MRSVMVSERGRRYGLYTLTRAAPEPEGNLTCPAHTDCVLVTAYGRDAKGKEFEFSYTACRAVQ